MLGRALEAVCRHKLSTDGEQQRMMLGQGIKKLREKNIIDARLFDWAEQLQASRNLAAHAAQEGTISLQDAKDLQALMCAMVEYIYDLNERYEDFKQRREGRRRVRRLVVR